MSSVARAKVEELGPGAQLGRYRLVRELGRGAMGLVFLADDTVLKQQLCVKVLDPRLVHNPEAMERFHREIVLARRIAHRSVCRLHDLHQDNGLHFITMEYVDGVALRDLLGAEQLPLPIGRVTTIVKNICDALAAAHDVNVIHRDLKPANVMVCAGDEINLLDFGIATADDLRSSLTLPGVAVGTRHYIAPEVWTGRPATAKSDQFSVGVILYNCLTRQRPFNSDKELFLIEAMKAGPPPPPSQWRPEIPRSLDEVALRALSFSPLSRYADIRALAAAIADVERREGLTRPSFHSSPGIDATVRSRAEAITAPRGVNVGEATMPPASPAPLPPPLHGMNVITVPNPSNTQPLERPRRNTRTILAAAATLCVVGVVTLAWPDTDAIERPVIDRSASAASGERVRAALDVRLDELEAPDGAPGAPGAAGDAAGDTVADAARVAGEAGDVAAADVVAPIELVVAAPPAARVERRAARSQANDKQKRWSDARAAVQKAMQDRGVIAGDDGELDRLRARAAGEAKARRYDEAAELEGQARRRADAIVIDKAFVKKKLVRFNGRFDESKDAAARARVDGVSTDVLNAMHDGRAQEANRALNTAFAALARRSP